MVKNTQSIYKKIYMNIFVFHAPCIFFYTRIILINFLYDYTQEIKNKKYTELTQRVYFYSNTRAIIFLYLSLIV